MNGLIIQWGLVTPTSESRIQFKFPLNFSNTNYSITGTPMLSSVGSSTNDKACRFYSHTNSSAYVYCNGNSQCRYIAIGY